jgi:hypothetical protein
MLDGLALLPVADVEEGMEFFRENFPEEGEELIDYFDVNYVRGTYRRIQRPNRPLRFRHIPHRFPPPLWNVHDVTIQGDDTVQCEGWNNKFSI